MARKNLLKGFKKPKGITFEHLETNPNYGKFIAYPFEPGFGTTIGNTLRRVLLSSIQGYAVTSVRITSFDAEGVPRVIQSEFDPDGKIIYGTRRSDNKFKGSQVLKQEGGRGPDTGDRLFRTLTSMENSKRSVVVQGGLKDSDGLHDPIQT